MTTLVGCDQPSIEVRVHDIRMDPLHTGSLDLIHARLVPEHLPARLTVIDRLVAALHTGGWLLVEDFDASGLLYLPVERLLCEPKGCARHITRRASPARR